MFLHLLFFIFKISDIKKKNKNIENGNNKFMIKTFCDIGKIKRAIKDVQGENVFVKVNLGRNKFSSYKGKIDGVYPALFTVVPNREYLGKTSFSYAEIMCNQVIIKRIKDK